MAGKTAFSQGSQIGGGPRAVALCVRVFPSAAAQDTSGAKNQMISAGARDNEQPYPDPFCRIRSQIAMAEMTGRVAVMVTPEGSMDQAARSANRLAKGAIARLIDSAGFKKGQSGRRDFPQLARWHAGGSAGRAGAAAQAGSGGRAAGGCETGQGQAAGKRLTVMAGSMNKAADLALGMALRDYAFENHKSPKEDRGRG